MPDQDGDRTPHFWIAAVAFMLLCLLTSPSFGELPVTLTWQANTDADLDGYEFYRGFVPCAQAVEGTTLKPLIKLPKTATTWSDPAVPNGTQHVCYGLKAFDTSNNFSPMSNLAGKAFVRPTPVLLGHWTAKTTVPHDPKHNLKTYTIHSVVNPKAAMTAFSPSLVKNYTYFLYAAVKGYCGDGGIMVGHTGTNRVCVNQPLPPGTWSSITATYDGTTLTLYRNKVLVGTMAMPPPVDSTETLEIGGSKFNETCNCDQEVWLYDQAMTASEIASLPSTSTAPAVIRAVPTVLSFTAPVGSGNPPTQTVAITNGGGGTLAWTATTTQPWITVTPSTGTQTGTLTVSIVRGTLPVGTHLGSVTLTATGASSVSISVTLTVPPDTIPPKAPTGLQLSARPSASQAELTWQQPGGEPTQYRIDFFRSTAWAEDHRVQGTVLMTRVTLPEIGRRVYRVCAVANGSDLCPKEGIWASR